jgi:hypothetical protein
MKTTDMKQINNRQKTNVQPKRDYLKNKAEFSKKKISSKKNVRKKK